MKWEEEEMNILRISAVALFLAILLGMAVGCAEQEQKSKDTGKAIINTVKDAESNINDAVSKMQNNTAQLEDVEK